MKIAKQIRLKRFLPSSKRGVALVTVLTVMSLTTIMVLTFFSLATSEHKASFTYSNGLQAQQVAEQAINMAIAQIREATSGSIVGKNAWASQPGAIRTWTTGGAFDSLYKLYSDEVMKTPDPADAQNDFLEIGGWDNDPDIYVDLNEPVIRGEKVYYPIVHPSAENTPRWPNPMGGDRDGVEGFTFDESQVAESELGQDAAKVAGAKGHVAMPVKWLYQLADGTIGYMAGGTPSSGYTFSPISGAGSPTEDNQIVARFAFWADDETSKLNINTHAGGLAWDIPKAGGELDMAMGRFQPAQHEWQRYPGHPATTHLGPALAPGILNIVNDRDAMEMLFDVVPRVVGGGSESGTRLINTRNPAEANGLIADTEPLFPTLDDMIMRSDREPHEFPDAQGNPIPADELSEYLERSRFFVTAVSRAPETNMFNLPRVAIWPIYNAERDSQTYETHLSPFDRLIHYCASVGGGSDNPYDYIFKREKADSPTYDYANIPRNIEIYQYLLYLMQEPVPGYGASFFDKYPEDAQQILTMIFDYIRSTNLHDDTLYDDFEDAFASVNTANTRAYTNPRDLEEPGFGHKGHGQVVPIRIDGTGGMGRFFTLAGAEVHVICAGQPGAVGPKYPGVVDYRGRTVDPPEGQAWMNLPPLPPGTQMNVKSSQPTWLQQLEMSNPDEYAAAFEQENWNWQLAFLDAGYRDAVLSNPSANKYNRSLITKAACENMRLKQGEKCLQAAFHFNLFCPSIGWGSINPDMEVVITRKDGMRFDTPEGEVGFLGFDDARFGEKQQNVYIWATNWAKPHKQGGARSWGGLLPFGYTMSARQPLQERGRDELERNLWWHMSEDGFIRNRLVRCRLTPLDVGYNQIDSQMSKIDRDLGGNDSDIAQAYKYDLVTVPFRVAADTVAFQNSRVNFQIFSGGTKHTESSATDAVGGELIQDIDLEFPAFQMQAPFAVGGYRGRVNEFDHLSNDSGGPLEFASLTADPANPVATSTTKARMRGLTGVSGGTDNGNNTFTNGRMVYLTNHWDGRQTYIMPGDVVRQVAVRHGDIRLVMAKDKIEANDSYYRPHRNYNNGNVLQAHSLTNAIGAGLGTFQPSTADERDHLIIPDLPGNNSYNNRIPFPFPTEKSEQVQLYGDFDNGSGTMIDGPYINKPDEGNVHSLRTRMTQEINDYWEARRNYGEFPYYSHPEYAESGGPAYFSPNRLVSGPGMFGSIPTGVNTDRPWQTLLFRPNVIGNGYSDHPGAVSPPDHLLMDFFWMPVVEPYAISEPLSTAGKVNLNYQILPFLHITRNTALRGVFRSEFMVCIPKEWHQDYKHARGRGRGYHWRDNPYGGKLQGVNLRSAIVDQATLDQFETKFADGADAFKSATEICDIHLIPEDIASRINKPSSSMGTYTPELEEMEDGSYWRDHSLVGDNSRERPYANIQQRVTTKSNTFRVHYRAQVLKQSRRTGGSGYETWKPELDSVVAEYRGDSIVERFVDPNLETLPDFSTSAPSGGTDDSIDPYYEFRVVNPRRFAP
ncbi:MAG: hypothetical protein CMO55_27155 [Verrucomicrobiales bacterium]|nr:hypothetical protein [Verrucomicrobiales bacterium]